MTMSRTALCLVAAAALLAACTKPAGNQASTSGAPAASSGPDVTITEADLPHLKAGLWVTSVSEDGGAPTTSKHCETGETIKPKEMSKACSTFDFKRTFLGGIVIDAVCGERGMSSTMHMTAHGDFNSSFSGDSKVTLTMPNQPPHTFTSHSESHYVGPCPPGGADG